MSSKKSIIDSGVRNEITINGSRTAVIEKVIGIGDQIYKLTASDATSGDLFGSVVSISENYIIIGVPINDDNGSNSGCAYVFDVTTGNELYKLVSSDIAVSDQFGFSVSVFGSYAIVGSPYDDDDGASSGGAYIFDLTTGNQIYKLTSSDANSLDQFGYSVGISSNYAIVGVPYDDDNGASSGSAYIFDINTGLQIYKLTASDGASGDNFGKSVSISGDSVIVGADGNDDSGSGSGSAYIYSKDQGGVDNWGEVYKLLASDGASGDGFGWSVGIDGNYAVVGAFKNDDSGSSSGSAYIFDLTTGLQKYKLTASDAAENDQFGYSVSISGSSAIVGSPYDDDNGASSGGAYIYDAVNGATRYSLGNELYKLLALDGSTDDQFGYSVSIFGNYAVVGSPYDDDNGSNSGSAYVFLVV